MIRKVYSLLSNGLKMEVICFIIHLALSAVVKLLVNQNI